jgi:large subunit ribosomal protein L10
MTSHTVAWKKAQLEELTTLANQYPVIAVASLRSFPASLFQGLRKKLKGKAEIRVSKTRVIRKAFEQSSIDSEKLNSYVNDSIAIIFTSMNPFEIYAFLKKNKGDVAAKEGSLAQNDIVVPAGDTGLPPGPALSDLKGAGLKVMVQGATISIAEDKVVTKKGEPVSAAVAGTLSKLGIKPIKVGLNIVACYENKEVFEGDVLNIDEEEVRNNFIKAYTQAFNLAFNAGYFIKETIPLLLQKAFRESKAVALEAEVLSPATIEEFIAKAARQASALKSNIPTQAPTEAKAEEKVEEKAEEKKEEPKAEEKKEEPKAEEKKEEPKAEEKKEEPAKDAAEEKKE